MTAPELVGPGFPSAEPSVKTATHSESILLRTSLMFTSCAVLGQTLESVHHCLLTSVCESVHPLTVQTVRVNFEVGR